MWDFVFSESVFPFAFTFYTVIRIWNTETAALSRPRNYKSWKRGCCWRSFHSNSSAAHEQTENSRLATLSTVHLFYNTLVVVVKGRGWFVICKDIFEAKKDFQHISTCLRTRFNRDFSPYCTVLAASRYRSGIRKWAYGWSRVDWTALSHVCLFVIELFS